MSLVSLKRPYKTLPLCSYICVTQYVSSYCQNRHFSVGSLLINQDGKGGDDLAVEKLSEAQLDKILRAISITVDDKKVTAKDMLREVGGKDLDFATYRDMMVARLKAVCFDSGKFSFSILLSCLRLATT